MKKLVFLLLTLWIFIFSVPTSFARVFSDIGNHRYKNAIEFLASENIIQGYPDGTFRPYQTVKRGELLKIAMESLYHSLPPQNCFTDVRLEHWFSKYACRAETLGIIQGYPDGSFRGSQDVKFVEALKILQISNFLPFEASEGRFWFQKSVEQASHMNLIPFDIRSFDQKMTRGQMADMLTRLLKRNRGDMDAYLGEKNTFRHTFDTLKNGLPAERMPFRFKKLTAQYTDLDSYYTYLDNLSVQKIPYASANASDKEILDRTNTQDSILWRYQQVAIAVPQTFHERFVRHQLVGFQNCLDGLAEYFATPFRHDELEVIYQKVGQVWGAPARAGSYITYQMTEDTMTGYSNYYLKTAPAVGWCTDSHETTHVFMWFTPTGPLTEGIASYMGTAKRSSANKPAHLNELESPFCLKNGIYQGGGADESKIEVNIEPYSDLSEIQMSHDIALYKKYYETGACVFDYVEKELGREMFLKVIEKMFSLWDPAGNRCETNETYRREGVIGTVFRPVLGDEQTNIIRERFGLRGDECEAFFDQ